ncbi:unnamed protein product [Meloidogyne enterolobii]|uniref:Uncharacterized protein n=1 Tax=Meloidogyne enterolobii TaxID=390850 RepID=A0ACB1A158_MELEN
MKIHLIVPLISVFASGLLVYALERCDDKHGGYCIGGRSCCRHGPPLCCRHEHVNCIPRIGLNYNNTKCERLYCQEGEVCMTKWEGKSKWWEGKSKCVPKV